MLKKLQAWRLWLARRIAPFQVEVIRVDLDIGKQGEVITRKLSPRQ